MDHLVPCKKLFFRLISRYENSSKPPKKKQTKNLIDLYECITINFYLNSNTFFIFFCTLKQVTHTHDEDYDPDEESDENKQAQ